MSSAVVSAALGSHLLLRGDSSNTTAADANADAVVTLLLLLLLILSTKLSGSILAIGP